MPREWPPKHDSSYIPSPDHKHWNPKLETMDPEERERKVILPKLLAQLSYAYKHSDLYKRKWDAAGITPEDVRSLADFEHVPFTTKDDLLRDQREFPPFGSNVCVGLKDLARVLGTSGTTGRPTVFAISKGDIARIAEAHARVMWG